MTDYRRRIGALEQTLAPKASAPRIMVTVQGEDLTAEEARFRSDNNWPDDGLHPVQIYVICVPGLYPDDEDLSGGGE